MNNGEKENTNTQSRFLLFGGLGNQLFQIAHGLSLTADPIVFFDRFNSSMPEIRSHNLDQFILPNRIGITDIPTPPKLINKLMNLGLRVSSKIGESNRFRSVRTVMVSMISKIYFLFSGQSIQFNYGVGKGFSNHKDKINLTVGYFQYFHSKKIIQELFSIKPRNPSQDFLVLVEKLKKTNFLCVHIRMGDYLDEDQIGIPKPEFYLAAIKKLRAENRFESIYIFSNEIAKAREYLNPNENDNTYFIGDSDFSTAEAFELMRHAHGYVISNSTFSWWASVLSYSENPPTVCPIPWFEKLAEPVGLIPTSWIRLDRNFAT
jgi:hypothetical protein